MKEQAWLWSKTKQSFAIYWIKTTPKNCYFFITKLTKTVAKAQTWKSKGINTVCSHTKNQPNLWILQDPICTKTYIVALIVSLPCKFLPFIIIFHNNTPKIFFLWVYNKYWSEYHFNSIHLTCKITLNM